jgi:hypothetical protein
MDGANAIAARDLVFAPFEEHLMIKNVVSEIRRLKCLRRVTAGAMVPALIALACSSPDLESDAKEPLGTSQEALHTVAGKTWTPQGPAPITNGQQFVITPGNPVTGGGHAVAPHPTNPNIIYFGGINAGIWRTNNATATQPTWTPLTDFQPSLNIGALALDRNNPNVVIAGTGRWSSLGNDGGSQGEVWFRRTAARAST